MIHISFSEQPFYGTYSTSDSHANTVISHAIAYSSRWLRKPCLTRSILQCLRYKQSFNATPIQPLRSFNILTIVLFFSSNNVCIAMSEKWVAALFEHREVPGRGENNSTSTLLGSSLATNIPISSSILLH